MADYVIRDDLEAQVLYGIEPYERTDLLTKYDSDLAMLADRALRVRSAATAPRVRSVRLDASTSDGAADLMATVDVYEPSRYRCRLKLDRGLVFDDEYFATSVAVEMTRESWTMQLNLDLSDPFSSIGGAFWDEDHWDQGDWSPPPP